MDKTETYIKMCEKAEEIQKIFREKSVNEHSEDISKCTSSDGGCMARGFNGLDACDKCEYNTVWLPRQDQLQEMLPTHKTVDGHEILRTGFDFVSRINSWIFFDCDTPDGSYLWSMEQLWLAFVMKEKYQKTWDSEKEEWVK